MLSDEEIEKIASETDCSDDSYGHIDEQSFARAIESAATEPLLARIADLQEEMACVQQALPEQWRDSVPSVAVATLVAELEVTKKDAKRWRYVVNHGTIDCDAFYWSKNGRGIDYPNRWVDAAIKEQK